MGEMQDYVFREAAKETEGRNLTKKQRQKIFKRLWAEAKRKYR